MFLAWLNQIVAQVDKADADAIFPILSNIAKEYPQALIHPLRISSDRFSFPDSPQGKHKKNEIARYFQLIMFRALLKSGQNMRFTHEQLFFKNARFGGDFSNQPSK